MNVVDTIKQLFETGGNAAYFGEPVSQTEHALQTANLAEKERSTDALIVAALLHDVGHLLHGLPETIANQGIDARHEAGGYHWLRKHFGPAVCDPVRLHVAAKRYLCAVDANYLALLSPASRQSLELQGGPFDAAGVRAFEAEPYFTDAVRLRHWDDQAKIPGLEVAPLTYYAQRIAASLRDFGGAGNVAAV
jgi:phosphonate degradation associated HDIG domain protein